MIFDKKIEKLKEGCGREYITKLGYVICSGQELVCGSCKAEIKATEECNKKVEEFVKEMKEIINDLNLDGEKTNYFLQDIDNLIKQFQEKE